MTVSSETANALDALAKEIEAVKGGDARLDTELHNLILEPAQVICGMTLQPQAAYTGNLITALNRLRPHGFKFAVQEIWAPQPSPTHVAGFEKKGEEPGFIVGGASGFGQGATLTLAGCAAIARLWAAVIREWLQAQPQGIKMGPPSRRFEGGG